MTADILSFHTFSVNEDFVVTLTKNNSNSIDQEQQETCKILKFSSEWNFVEILSTISKLEPKNYPNLFIFIIDVENFGFLNSIEEKQQVKVEVLQENLLKFNRNRPLVLQLTSKDENVTEFYYKKENAEEFLKIEESAEELTDFNDFSTFLWMFLNGRPKTFKKRLMPKLQSIKDSSTIVRFLRTLVISEGFFHQLIQKCASVGNKFDFLAAVDENFDEIHENQLKYFADDLQKFISTLEKAMIHKNLQIILLLIKNCKKLIQKLPLKIQIDVSTEIYDRNNLENFCDLLEFQDCPFPRNFNEDEVTDIRLCQIIYYRAEFYKNIEAEHLQEIEKFIKIHPNLIKAFNVKNKTALNFALELEKFPSFFCLLKILTKNFDRENFKKFILDFKIVESFISSLMDLKDVETFFDMLAMRGDLKFASDCWKMKHDYDPNSFVILIQSENLKGSKVKEFIEIVKKFLNSDEIIELITATGSYGNNALSTCAEMKNLRKVVVIVKIFKPIMTHQKFIDFITQQMHYKNILHMIAEFDKKEHHQTLWRLLLSSFEDIEELKDFILDEDGVGNKFMSYLLRNKNQTIIEYTIKKILNIFNASQCREIFKIYYLRYSSNGIKIDKLLLQAIHKSYETDQKFLKLLKKDETIKHAVKFRSGDFFQILIDEIENVKLPKITKRILKLNFLRFAVFHNSCLELHQNLWTAIRKYFNYEEIFDFLSPKKGFKSNIFLTALKFNSIEVAKLTWNQIKEILPKDELENFLKSTNSDGNNFIDILTIKGNEIDLEYFWSEAESHFLCHKKFRELLSQKNPKTGQNFIHIAATQIEVKFHEIFWKLLLNTFNNQEELMNLILQNNQQGNNFIHCLAGNETPNVIRLNFTKINENFSEANQNKILFSKGQNDKNLFQSAAENPQNVKILWQNIQKVCKSEEFLEFLKEIDEENNNIFHIIVQFRDKIAFEFMIGELEATMEIEKIREILATLGKNRQNLLQLAATEDIKIYQILWRIFKIYFKSSEIVDILGHAGDDGDNLLMTAIKCEENEVLELTWNNIKELFSENSDAKLVDFLKATNIDGMSILQVLITQNDKNLLQYFLLEFQNCLSSQELIELFSQKTKDGKNSLNCAVCSSRAKIFDFIMKILENLTSKVEIKSLLNFQNENILHVATKFNKSLELHKILWKIVENYFSSSEILEMIHYCDKNGDNVLQNVVSWNQKKIIKFTWNQIESFVETKENQIEYLMKNGHGFKNLLEMSLENDFNNRKSRIWITNIIEIYENVLNIEQN